MREFARDVFLKVKQTMLCASFLTVLSLFACLHTRYTVDGKAFNPLHNPLQGCYTPVTFCSDSNFALPLAAVEPMR
jgi:hypothetical protein